MKYILTLVTVVLLISACTQKGITIDTSKPTELATELDSVSYLLGTSYAKGLTTKGGVKELDNKSFITGVQRVLEGKDVEIDEETAGDFMNAYFDKKEKSKSAEAKLAGEDFLAKNKDKEGVKTTETGLQYRVITAGGGALPIDGDKVKVHYTGKLIDGTVFDSSVERGEPAEFLTNQVIPGWTEALMMMPVGSKYELVIPASLAYGDRSTGPIPAGSTLIFEVELLDILPDEITLEKE
jgi:FKBP-type peptidyl-prolyl cis-trans isomerase